MQGKSHIGIDLGGTNIRAGILQNNILQNTISRRLDATGNSKEILQQVFDITDALMQEEVASIGIGVPGLVDANNSMVYDVVNIPSWQKISLQQWMETRYKIPVVINNDANCFALGEYRFGEGIGCNNMAGLTIGTGLGAGLILNKKLYSGRNGGAGEFGMMPYLDKCYEYYASGQFFKNVFNISGEIVYANALNNDASALNMFEVFGTHLGNAIKAILFAVDIEVIVLGGSVKNAYSFFEKAMWQQIQNFPYQQAVQHLKIKIAGLEHSGIIGAASLSDDLQQ
ncbi:ROK family protein [soil metagenome]